MHFGSGFAAKRESLLCGLVGRVCCGACRLSRLTHKESHVTLLLLLFPPRIVTVSHSHVSHVHTLPETAKRSVTTFHDRQFVITDSDSAFQRLLR